MFGRKIHGPSCLAQPADATDRAVCAFAACRQRTIEAVQIDGSVCMGQKSTDYTV